MHDRITAAKSELSKEKLGEDYREHRGHRDRIQGNSPQRQEDLRELLKRKFKVEPSVILPKINQKPRPYLDEAKMLNYVSISSRDSTRI